MVYRSNRLAIPIVDTHQHLWDIQQFDLPWVEGAGPLKKNHTMDDYLATVDGLDVAKTVYMEVDVVPHDREREVEFVIDMCERDDNPMAGAVVSGEPGSEGFAEYVRGFAGNDRIKGIRRVLHTREMDKGHCLNDEFIGDVRLLGELGLTYDICMRPDELADGIELVDRCPGTRFIVDHCGNADPAIVAGTGDSDSHGRDQWIQDMEAFGQRPHVTCKISGIVARVSDTWTADDLAPTINHCLDVFDSERVIAASDWPVCTLGASLADWFSALRSIISSRSETDQRRLLHDNAVELFGLS